MPDGLPLSPTQHDIWLSYQIDSDAPGLPSGGVSGDRGSARPWAVRAGTAPHGRRRRRAAGQVRRDAAGPRQLIGAVP
ncbi:hypothetical protein GTV15_11935, partial [Streptomyces sp. SID7803]|nr:hypothetical protein [Streptomyces sp. SID7803]